MAPLPPLPRHLTSLSRLPIDDLRRYATLAYNNPPYTQQISDVLATGMFFAPGAVLIALYPPEVPPEKALAEPPDFPTWRYYLDGRWLYIATRQEYDGLDPRHSGRPDGPWPDGVETQVPWTIGQGPYAPVEGWRPYGSASEPQGHPDKRGYATMPLIYYGRAYAVGEVFFLLGESVMDDDKRIAAAVVKIVPRSATPVPHPQTGRWFIDATTLAAYARRYQDGDVTVFVAAETERDTGTRAHRSERRFSGRPPGSGLIYPEFEELIALLTPVVLAFRENKKRWPTRQEAIDATKWPDRKPTVDNLADRFRRAQTTYTAWLDSLETTHEA